MKRSILMSSLIVAHLTLAAATASAENLKLSDLQEKGAAKLSRDEVQQALSGAKVKSVVPTTGSTRQWTNDAGGKFTASSDNRSAMGGKGGLAQAQGNWNISDDGRYCVQIDWRAVNEKWCRTMYKLGDKYYGVAKDGDPASAAWEFDFSK